MQPYGTILSQFSAFGHSHIDDTKVSCGIYFAKVVHGLDMIHQQSNLKNLAEVMLNSSKSITALFDPQSETWAELTSPHSQ